jgi:hypothetical protein
VHAGGWRNDRFTSNRSNVRRKPQGKGSRFVARSASRARIERQRASCQPFLQKGHSAERSAGRPTAYRRHAAGGLEEQVDEQASIAARSWLIFL